MVQAFWSYLSPDIRYAVMSCSLSKWNKAGADPGFLREGGVPKLRTERTLAPVGIGSGPTEAAKKMQFSESDCPILPEDKSGALSVQKIEGTHAACAPPSY